MSQRIRQYESPEAYRQRWQEEAPHIPYGYCQCGCGQQTTVSRQNCKTYQRTKGEPQRFVKGHQTRQSAELYEEVNTGHKTPCWLWLRGQTNGYGIWGLNGTQVYAHRAFYELENEVIPPGYEVHHKCQHRRCVNPAHLEALTKQQHNRRHRLVSAFQKIVKRQSQEAAW